MKKRKAKPGEPMEFLMKSLGSSRKACIYWPYARGDHGYGTVTVDGKTQLAHRVMCKMKNGDAPENDMDAAHSCGNGKSGCINPNHLSWKTRKENCADTKIHERAQEGERHYNVKLTEQQVWEIRTLGEVGASPDRVAKKYGISSWHARSLMDGLYWKHMS